MAKILLVDDDARLLDPLSRWLKKQGHSVETAMSGNDALQMLSVYTFDIIVLDWDLPDISGLNVIKTYRQTGGSTPTIFLTGKSDSSSKRQGLDSGADDYLAKPFDSEELGARIRALMRRPAGLLSAVLTAGNVRLQLDTQNVLVDDAPVALGRKEYAILEHLMRHPNRSFSSKELLAAIWPSDTESSEDSVRSCVRVLRTKISKNNTCIISTAPGGGYKIDAQ